MFAGNKVSQYLLLVWAASNQKQEQSLAIFYFQQSQNTRMSTANQQHTAAALRFGSSEPPVCLDAGCCLVGAIGPSEAASRLLQQHGNLAYVLHTAQHLLYPWGFHNSHAVLRCVMLGHFH